MALTLQIRKKKTELSICCIWKGKVLIFKFKPWKCHFWNLTMTAFRKWKLSRWSIWIWSITPKFSNITFLNRNVSNISFELWFQLCWFCFAVILFYIFFFMENNNYIIIVLNRNEIQGFVSTKPRTGRVKRHLKTDIQYYMRHETSKKIWASRHWNCVNFQKINI